MTKDYEALASAANELADVTDAYHALVALALSKEATLEELNDAIDTLLILMRQYETPTEAKADIGLITDSDDVEGLRGLIINKNHS